MTSLPTTSSMCRLQKVRPWVALSGDQAGLRRSLPFDLCVVRAVLHDEAFGGEERHLPWPRKGSLAARDSIEKTIRDLDGKLFSQHQETREDRYEDD
jgi:hypothetical protein